MNELDPHPLCQLTVTLIRQIYRVSLNVLFASTTLYPPFIKYVCFISTTIYSLSVFNLLFIACLVT